MGLIDEAPFSREFPPREHGHRRELREGDLWHSSGCNSEYASLREVVLYGPTRSFDADQDFGDRLFDRDVSAAELSESFRRIARAYQDCGVKVHVVEPAQVDDKRHPNTVFQRDLFWSTPFGVLIARMASSVRAGEERSAAATIASIGCPTAMTVVGGGTLEGADLLWLRPDDVLCGIGNRTNPEGFEQVAAVLERERIRVTRVPAPTATQHLLGGVQIVSSSRALVRIGIVDKQVTRALASADYEIIEVPEVDDVRYRQAFNLVTVRPNTVLIPRSAWFAEFLSALDIEVVGQVEVDPHIAAGGGLACATGILTRDLV